MSAPYKFAHLTGRAALLAALLFVGCNRREPRASDTCQPTDPCAVWLGGLRPSVQFATIDEGGPMLFLIVPPWQFALVSWSPLLHIWQPGPFANQEMGGTASSVEPPLCPPLPWQDIEVCSVPLTTSKSLSQ